MATRKRLVEPKADTSGRLTPDKPDAPRRRSSSVSKLLPTLENDSSNNGDVYIIALDKSTPGITVDWFIELLTKKKTSGGAELEVTLIDDSDSELDVILLQVSASSKRYKWMKQNSNHVQLEDEFVNLDHDSAKDDQQVISNSEKQRLLLHELESLCSNEKETLFGVRDLKLYPGQSILGSCKKSGIIKCYFPTHDWPHLKLLEHNWVFTPSKQPIRAVRNYFGDSIAFYFSFLDFYTTALIVPSILGLITYFLGHRFSDFVAITCIFNAIWTALFIKYWKRKSNTLAHEFGTLEVINYEPCRPLFRGRSLGIDPVTGKPCPIYPIQKTWFQEYFISMPIVFICLILSTWVMLLYFDVENYVIELSRTSDDPNSWFWFIAINIPGIIYAILVSVSNIYYRQFAKFLNHLENHRSQSSHENHLLVKLILFEFVNNFGSIFYVGFWIRDIGLLKYQIVTMLIVYQALDTMQEVLIPLYQVYSYRPKSGLKCDILKQYAMTEFEDTYFDYLELFIQFGYVFMFSSVFPLAPILALANNLIEKRSDAFKLCKGHQRPNQRPASGINSAWLRAFEVLGYVSIVSNCLLLAIVHTPSVSKIEGSKTDCGLKFIFQIVGLEHAIFFIVLLLNYVIPDVPKAVRVASLKKHYQSNK